MCNKDCASFCTSLRTRSEWPLISLPKSECFVERYPSHTRIMDNFFFSFFSPSILQFKMLFSTFITVVSDDCSLVSSGCQLTVEMVFRPISGHYWWIVMFLFFWICVWKDQSERVTLRFAHELVLCVSWIFQNRIWDSCCISMICPLMTSDLLVLYCNNLSISSVVHASAHLALYIQAATQ